jgi:hypothetical protein
VTLRAPRVACQPRQVGSPARLQAAWSQHPAEPPAQESETGFRRPAVLRVSALPQAQAERV